MLRIPVLLLLLVSASQSQPGAPLEVRPHHVTVQTRDGVFYVTPAGDSAEEQLAIVEGMTRFQNGTIELEMSGRPGPGAAEGARGFVGVAFRVAADVSRFECFYLRPTNGRADDQLRRNHAAQYISFPGFPWERLRSETPGKYEAYVDLVPGEWTKVKVVVDGADARLYVHGNPQPTLLVTDLKHPAAAGGVGLWVGPGTEARFRNVVVVPK